MPIMNDTNFPEITDPTGEEVLYVSGKQTIKVKTIKKYGGSYTAVFDPASPCAIGETTPNTIRSLIKEIIKTSTGNLSAAEVSGTIINNYGQSADCTLTLPAAGRGMSFIALCGTTVAQYFRLKANADDKIYLDGTAGSDNQYVGLASVEAGNAISFVTFRVGESAYDWMATAISGTWAAEA